MNLPDEIQYDAMITTLQQLMPDLDPMLVSYVRIAPRHVTVEVWNGRSPELHQIPIRHKQSAATEGSGQ